MTTPSNQAAPAAAQATAVPAAPAAPAAPGSGAPFVVRPSQLAAPASRYTSAEIAALRQRGEELSRQLKSADGRRSGIQQRLQQGQGTDKAGLEKRLTVLDDRIANLELDIEENGRALASPAAAKVMASSNLGARREQLLDAMVPISIVFTVLVLFPMAFARARRIWRGADVPRQSSLPADTIERLERMEQGIDAIAIEVERVSEGQRFVTRLMSERAALGAGEAPMEPIRVGAQQSAGVPR